MVYEKKFVAFLDILGFKNMIKCTINNIAYQKKIMQVLSDIASIRQDNYHGFLSEYGVYKEVSVFSDSIVISYSTKLEIGGGLFHILIDLISICINLVERGIYVRGAVTCGLMHHDKNICFGPAMVKAYELEEESAIYPRIIIELSTICEDLKHPGQANSVKMEANYLRGIIKRDTKDKKYFLDYLSQWEEFNEPEDYDKFIGNVRKNLIECLQHTEYPEKIQEKYRWFKKYYNDTIRKAYIPSSDTNHLIIP